jgi:hypothetical protein
MNTLWAAVAQGLVWGFGATPEWARRDAVSQAGAAAEVLTFALHEVTIEECKEVAAGALVIPRLLREKARKFITPLGEVQEVRA